MNIYMSSVLVKAHQKQFDLTASNKAYASMYMATKHM